MLHVDLFAAVLADVPNKHPAGLAVEAVSEWIAQSERPDFSTRSADANKWILRRDRRSPSRGVNMNAEHLAEQRRQILCIPARLDVTGSLLVSPAAISCGDV